MNRSLRLRGRIGEAGETDDISPNMSLKAKELDTDVQGQEKVEVSAQAERADLPFLCHFGLFQAVMPTTLGRAICFTQSGHSDANLLQKHPHRHPQRSCSTRSLGIP